MQQTVRPPLAVNEPLTAPVALQLGPTMASATLTITLVAVTQPALPVFKISVVVAIAMLAQLALSVSSSSLLPIVQPPTAPHEQLQVLLPVLLV